MFQSRLVAMVSCYFGLFLRLSHSPLVPLRNVKSRSQHRRRELGLATTQDRLSDKKHTYFVLPMSIAIVFLR
ncbi:hypothetical protein F5Y16DRAFT_367472 [Xylariaceae sp. FL0255]|nr:hypothetical protein F5Y16DRAFT_367472 [Xylariaceae sp. FL0255]